MNADPTAIDLELHGQLRIAIVSDTHGQLDPRVAEAVAWHDGVIHAGDIGCAAVLEQLATKLDICIAVRGNNDVPAKWPVSDRTVLAGLRDIARLRLADDEVVIVHGHRAGRPATRHDRLRREFAGSRLVIYGHSHHRVIDREGRPWVVNPGAAGRARAYGGPGLLSLTVSRKEWKLTPIAFRPWKRRS